MDAFARTAELFSDYWLNSLGLSGYNGTVSAGFPSRLKRLVGRGEASEFAVTAVDKPWKQSKIAALVNPHRASVVWDLNSVVEDEVAVERAAENALDLMRACSAGRGLFSGAVGLGPSWPAYKASLAELHPYGRIDYVPLIGWATYIPESGEEITVEHSDELVEGGRIVLASSTSAVEASDYGDVRKRLWPRYGLRFPQLGYRPTDAAPNAHPLDCEGPAIGSSLVFVMNRLAKERLQSATARERRGGSVLSAIVDIERTRVREGEGEPVADDVRRDLEILGTQLSRLIWSIPTVEGDRSNFDGMIRRVEADEESGLLELDGDFSEVDRTCLEELLPQGGLALKPRRANYIFRLRDTVSLTG